MYKPPEPSLPPKDLPETCSDSVLFAKHQRLVEMSIDRWGKPAIEAIVEDYNVKETETNDLPS